MSLELHVFLPAGEWPSVRRWQAAVLSLSLPVELDPTLDLSTASGFVACRIGSVDSGFEIWSDSVSSITAA
jgi:hypothetical protein